MRPTRPTTYPKKIDPRERLYYHYKIDPTCYALFDSELNTPIAYGSYNLVGAVITRLPISTTIFYFEVDKRTGWKMKRSYNPKKEMVESEDAKNAVEKTEEKKKDLT